MKAKRYHPLLLLFEVWNLIKNASPIVIYLFVIKAGSETTFIKYGRIVFFVAVGITLISDLLKWFTHTYKLDNHSFHLYKGILNKSEQTIPFSRIQNVKRHRSLFHRIFKMTSITFETGTKGDDDSVKFEVISQQEADQMEAYLTGVNRDGVPTVQSSVDNLEKSSEAQKDSLDDVEVQKEGSDEAIVHKSDSNRTLHFKPTNKDMLKASFTSLSFLALIPLLYSCYSKMDDIFHIEKAVGGIFEDVMSSWWMVTIIMIVFVIASVAFGIVRTFEKYGKYQISSDDKRIYITQGIIDETIFSISKEKVQAVEIEQTFMKRLLGLAEVKLISAGSVDSGDDSDEINSLYPFLPVERAYEMVSEILPSYRVTENMNCLPKKSFWVRLLSPSWFWISATIGLYYFKPTILAGFWFWISTKIELFDLKPAFLVEQSWLVLSVILLILIVVARLLDFFQTRYTLNSHFIQFKQGILTTSLLVSKRDKVIEVKVSRNIIQKMLGLSSIEIVNRSKPVLHTGVSDVPVELASSFYKWYRGRRNEIKVE